MRYLLCLSMLCLMSCSNDTLPKYASLGGLRILALGVDTPEIQNPTGTVQVSLTPYISDIDGTGAVSLSVQSCLDPGVNLGATPDCTNAKNASSVQTVSIPNPTGQAAGTFGDPERTGLSSSGAITVPLQIPANFLSSYSQALQFNGVAFLITVKVTSGSNSVQSFRRVLISNKTPNTNPNLNDLLAGGSSLNSLPGGDSELSFASAAPENYQLMSSDGNLQSITENLDLTWFVSNGEINNYRISPGQTTTWKNPGATAGRKTVIVGVLRDGRGGTSVLIRNF